MPFRLAATAPGEGPVLRWVHFNVPHRPWLAGNGILDAGAFEPDLRRNAAQLDEVDRALAMFLNGLRSAGRYDDATIVIIADHGERFGEKRDDPHHVPLVVRAPHGSARENVVEQVEVRDVLSGFLATIASKRCASPPLALGEPFTCSRRTCRSPGHARTEDKKATLLPFL
jgi:membrane-anchored protein YejM (alkaline phosphatase superfamily)